ncbi:MAG: hypothetical protein DIZ80_16890 [endosymbiont of Galathealinum brachiosum]|uniref:Uncharacterized protein n=1 Tax=endosymbiont of Galathealinum brachiosum TaxID=2200906 RepID=A0A370D6Q1_9GAMM|nr:MAG: hypothetical protein DIZ80_16890 [endosymbiont of Galathealinum brachiosum]
MDGLILLLGALVVLLSAMYRFNNPHILQTQSTSDNLNWKDKLSQILSFNPGKHNLLLRPPRANTTAFRFRLYQFLYALLAMLIYLLVLLQPGISSQFQQIILWFVQEGLPDITNAGPLVIAAFVILILPNVPPFRWADIGIRSILYERALIPAQQLREINRLKRAPYNPQADLVEKVRNRAVEDNFHAVDVVYNSEFATTQSLWCKCLLLIENINYWEADDHYKTAFAVLKEPDSERRSVDVVKEIQQNLVADARVCLDKLRLNSGEKSEELTKRESEFRDNCRDLLRKIYSLLAGISLHSHYSDADRVKQFGKLGFKLEAEGISPLPNPNDMLILTIILCSFIVFPLAYKLGIVKAIMIGCIMFSAVLTPIVLARFCPRICDFSLKQYGPNVVYPLLSGLIAAFIAFMTFYIGGLFLEPTGFCEYTGVERYTKCSYPWSFLHSGIAILLSIRLTTGEYPVITKLKGWQRYRQWGDLKDAVICAISLMLIAAFIVIPLLEPLRPDPIEGATFWAIVTRMGIVTFILGFIVPTWYRAQKSRYSEENRRNNPDRRERFEQTLNTIRRGV